MILGYKARSILTALLDPSAQLIYTQGAGQVGAIKVDKSMLAFFRQIGVLVPDKSNDYRRRGVERYTISQVGIDLLKQKGRIDRLAANEKQTQCMQCGAVFKRTGRRYRKIFCSADCRTEHLRSTYHPTMRCEQCGKSFERRTRRRDTNRFCSQTCANKFRFPQKKPMVWVHKCMYCNKDIVFYKKPKSLKNRYCSNECAIAAKTQRNARIQESKERRRFKEELLVAAMRQIKRPSTCLECGSDKMWGRRKNSKYCSKRCWTKAGKRKRSHQMRLNRHNKTGESRIVPFDYVYRMWGGTCSICGIDIDLYYRHQHTHALAPTLDHVIPIAKGGSNSIDNLRPAHRVCNGLKGADDLTPLLRYKAQELVMLYSQHANP